MQTRNPLFDDLARLASSAVGVAAEVRNEFEDRFREQLEKALARFDLVTREEFDAVKAMAAAAREEQERLNARIDELESRLKAKPAKTTRARAKAPKSSAADGNEEGSKN